MPVRFMIPAAFVVGLVFSAVAPAPTLALETNDQRAKDRPTAPATAVDQTAARIKYLHDRLRITTEQESLWDAVAQAIRESEGNLAPLRREQYRAAISGSATELLRSDEALGNAQLDNLRKIISAFDPLYAGLSDDQKKIADAILREGAQNTMTSGIPFVPPPFSSALLYPSLLGWPNLPFVVHRPLGFRHFGRFHR